MDAKQIALMRMLQRSAGAPAQDEGQIPPEMAQQMPPGAPQVDDQGEMMTEPPSDPRVKLLIIQLKSMPQLSVLPADEIERIAEAIIEAGGHPAADVSTGKAA